MNEDHSTHQLLQKGSGVVWGEEVEWLMAEGIVKLLRETASQMGNGEGDGKRPKWLRQLEGGQQMGKVSRNVSM